jgi:hypothetical protein
MRMHIESQLNIEDAKGGLKTVPSQSHFLVAMWQLRYFSKILTYLLKSMRLGFYIIACEYYLFSWVDMLFESLP